MTNGKKFQVTKLEHSGLVDIVPFAIVSRLFGADKPDGRIYFEAIRRLKLSFDGIDDIQTSEILFVGDNPYTDITGAVGVGMKSAWVRVSARSIQRTRRSRKCRSGVWWSCAGCCWLESRRRVTVCRLA